jgi:hypothetical protein
MRTFPNLLFCIWFLLVFPSLYFFLILLTVSFLFLICLFFASLHFFGLRPMIVFIYVLLLFHFIFLFPYVCINANVITVPFVTLSFETIPKLISMAPPYYNNRWRSNPGSAVEESFSQLFSPSDPSNTI